MGTILQSGQEDAAFWAVLICLGVLVGILIGFMPTIIAFQRNHPNRTPILLVNLIPVLGWFVALIWALTSPINAVIVHTGEGLVPPTPPQRTSRGTIFVLGCAAVSIGIGMFAYSILSSPKPAIVTAQEPVIDTSSPTKPTPASMATPDIILDVEPIVEDQKISLDVKTNLPPKTVMMAFLIKPTGEEGNDYQEKLDGVVSNSQTIRFGPFTRKAESLSPGEYEAAVVTVPTNLQPEEIQPFFGEYGENLRGKLVLAVPETRDKVVSRKLKIVVPEASDASLDSQTP